jgi:hypothetical protein
VSIVERLATKRKLEDIGWNRSMAAFNYSELADKYYKDVDTVVMDITWHSIGVVIVHNVERAIRITPPSGVVKLSALRALGAR